MSTTSTGTGMMSDSVAFDPDVNEKYVDVGERLTSGAEDAPKMREDAPRCAEMREMRRDAPR